MLSVWTNPTTKGAYRLSIASIVIEIVAIIVGLVIYRGTGSSLSLVYGLENIVDCLSSFVVLWRFYAPSSVDEIVEKHLQEREQRASLAISWILLYLGFFVVWSAITDFVLGQVDFDDDTYKSTLVLSFISMIVFGILTLLKFKYAKVLSSESMHKDGLCSLIGTILSAAMFLSTLLVRANSNLWWLDPIIAFLAGLYAMYLGIVGLYTAVTVDKMSLCSCWCCGSSNSNTTNGEIESGNTASNNNNNADDSELV